jgi:formylglycine-generating enzyme required for sulfatase activity
MKKRSPTLMIRHIACLTVWICVCVSCSFDLPEPSEVAQQFASCTGLPRTCGSGGGSDSGSADCCEAAIVPGGTFFRGYDEATDDYNDKRYSATVSTFVLDKYEVTVGRFRAFLNAGLGTRESPPLAGTGEHPTLAGSGWDASWNTSLAADMAAIMAGMKTCTSNPAYPTWTDARGPNETKPINCVTWYEAMAFCIWDGGYLPTDSEWNYAASGGAEQRAYPWSNPPGSTVIDCTYANHDGRPTPETYCVNGTTGSANRVGSESPKGDGKWDHADLAGNVREWVLDWYAQKYPLPCDDCANLVASPPPDDDRVSRGGSFISEALVLRTGLRHRRSPLLREFTVGVRCARAL